jgi:signal transduction histidine kinase
MAAVEATLPALLTIRGLAMSFTPRRLPWRSLGVRLTLYYSAYFVAGVLLVLGLAYVLLSSSLQRKDRQQIQLELEELAALYRAGGVEAVQDFLAAQEASGTSEPFTARLIGPDGTLRFVWRPTPLGALDLEQLRTGPAVPAGQWTLVAVSGGPPLELTAIDLPDGSRLEVGGSTGDRNNALQDFRRIALLILVPALALGLVGGMLLASSALRPIREIVHAIRAVAEGKMGTRVQTRQSGDELDELIILFNEMLERIAALVEGMRGALDNVAHELRTPIMRIRGAAENAMHSAAEPEVVRQAVGEYLEELDQLLAMLNTLMDISEAEAGALKLRVESVDLSALLAEVVELYQFVAQEKGLTLSASVTASVPVMADRSRLRQVLANLVDNAIKYTAFGGRVEVTTDKDDGRAMIRVRDTGVGIPADELPRIWDRLYRGDGTRAQPGLGLGLSLVRAVVHAHGGRIGVTSAPGVGTEFTVVLPAGLPERSARPSAAQLSPL